MHKYISLGYLFVNEGISLFEMVLNWLVYFILCIDPHVLQLVLQNYQTNMMPFVLKLVEDCKNCTKSIALYDSVVQTTDRTEE